jgi:hypothetical protein
MPSMQQPNCLPRRLSLARCASFGKFRRSARWQRKAPVQEIRTGALGAVLATSRENCDGLPSCLNTCAGFALGREVSRELARVSLDVDQQRQDAAKRV